MGCNSCGEQPKHTNKDFTKAVIEIHNPETLVLLRKVIIPASMGTEEDVPAAIGKYRNVVLVYEANSHVYLYSSDGIPTLISSDSGDIEGLIERIEDLEGQDVILHGEIEDVADDLASETTAREQADTDLNNAIGDEITAREQADTALNTAIGDETAARQLADINLQGQIDAITASSDVKDIVGTKAELNNYDTSTLGNNDIIKVLQDESENDATTYYRWNAAAQQFTLIGEEGPYYTKSQADTLLNAKQNTLTAGSNVQITGDTISATDTTYTAGNGLNLTGTEFSADTTVLATQTDLAGKQNTLTAGAGIDITNDVISATGGGGPTVVQTTGTSTTDVMSQNAVTSTLYVDPSNKSKLALTTNSYRSNAGASTTSLGTSSLAWGFNSTAIGCGVDVRGTNAIGIGEGNTAGSAMASSQYAVAIGSNPRVSGVGSIAVGHEAQTSGTYSVVIGEITKGNDSANGVAIGREATVDSNSPNAIALGGWSRASGRGVMSINVTGIGAGGGYNNSNYRLLTGLYDGQNDHDAVTVGQLNTAIAGAGAAEINSTDWSALWQ